MVEVVGLGGLTGVKAGSGGSDHRGLGKGTERVGSADGDGEGDRSRVSLGGRDSGGGLKQNFVLT